MNGTEDTSRRVSISNHTFGGNYGTTDATTAYGLARVSGPDTLYRANLTTGVETISLDALPTSSSPRMVVVSNTLYIWASISSAKAIYAANKNTGSQISGKSITSVGVSTEFVEIEHYNKRIYVVNKGTQQVKVFFIGE